jgi:tetratricopeptide (TPR) repeat protein
VALTLSNLGNHLAFGANFEAAHEHSSRALAISVGSLGLDHPRTALLQANHGQVLCRLGRFDEAREAARQALVVFERETDASSFWVTFPLRTMGTALVGQRRFDEAVPLLERAVVIRDQLERNPQRLAEVHCALARALSGRGAPGDEARAYELAVRAKEEYARASATPVVALDVRELDAWFASRALTPPLQHA